MKFLLFLAINNSDTTFYHTISERQYSDGNIVKPAYLYVRVHHSEYHDTDTVSQSSVL